MQALMYWCADTVKQAVHHLEGGCHANRSLGDFGSCHGDKCIALCRWWFGPPGTHGLGQRSQLCTKSQCRDRAISDRGDSEIQVSGVAARTEERCVCKQSIETLIQVRGTSGQVFDLSSCQLIAVRVVAHV